MMFDSPDEGQDQSEEVIDFDPEGNSPEAEKNETDASINPVWEPIRQELGAKFEIIKPHLLEIDKGYNKGITSANEKFSPWKQFADAGITPEFLTNSLATLQQFDQDPVSAYQALGAFLEKEGRLPKTAAEAAEAIDLAEGQDDELTEEQKELAALREQVTGFQNMFQQRDAEQEQQRLDQQAETEVAQEFDSFKAAHPGLDPVTLQEVLQRQYLYAASGAQNIKSLEEVFLEVDNLKKSFSPRPNDTAPRLPGAGGGVPTGERKKIEELSREESQNLLADLVSKASQ